VLEFFVLRVPSLLLASGVLWDQNGFNILVQLVEQDIGEDRAGNRSLWNSRKGAVELMVGGEVTFSTANSELCMTLSRHTAPQSMVTWY
jgi:hypothetical protein